MARFRRVVTQEIEAVQWDGSNEAAVAELAPGAFACMAGNAVLWIEKSKIWAPLPTGSFVIAEPDGIGVYPCEPSIFAATYEAV